MLISVMFSLCETGRCEYYSPHPAHRVGFRSGFAGLWHLRCRVEGVAVEASEFGAFYGAFAED